MIIREDYINRLKQWQDKDIIKVITGIRRSGKSTLFLQFIEELKKQEISQSQIIYINFEDLAYDNFTYKSLYNYVLENSLTDKKMYLFFDEIQNILNFEKAIDSLFIKGNFDIYLTGSNSYMMSSELATKLRGRFIEIKMLPLSFKECFSIKKMIKMKPLNIT